MRYNKKALLMIKEAPENKKIPLSRMEGIYDRLFAVSNQTKSDVRENMERNQEQEIKIKPGKNKAIHHKALEPE